jgi:DNA-binding transcriptional regulator GbsR (MarR family)
VEVEVIQLFVQLSRALGQPPSVGEIYGLLFVSPKPLTFDDLVERLDLSNGSASQGLKYLRELGAVQIVEIANVRRTHYEPVAELRKLAGLFLRQQIAPHLEESATQLQQIASEAKGLQADGRKHVVARIELLQSWERNASRILPFLLEVLGSADSH